MPGKSLRKVAELLQGCDVSRLGIAAPFDRAIAALCATTFVCLILACVGCIAACNWKTFDPTSTSSLGFLGIYPLPVQADSGSGKPSADKKAATAGAMRIAKRSPGGAKARQDNVPGAATNTGLAHFQEEGSGLTLCVTPV